MAETSNVPREKEITVMQLARAVRLAFVCLVLIFSAAEVRVATAIRPAERILEDMLGTGTMLPAISRFVFFAQQPLLIISCLIPVCCLLTLLDRKIIRAIYVLCGLALLSVILNAVIWQAVTDPVLEVIKRMQGGGPSL